MGQHLFNEKFESVDAISEGNMPSRTDFRHEMKIKF
jgi:hypothetical protein